MMILKAPSKMKKIVENSHKMEISQLWYKYFNVQYKTITGNFRETTCVSAHYNNNYGKDP